MNVTITSSKVFKIGSYFYSGSAKEEAERGFLISNLSAGNITLCCKQPVFHMLQVDWACSKAELKGSGH